MNPRKIIIEPAMNGLVVRVGCKRVVFEKTDVFIDWLKDYFKNPEGTEKKFIENFQLWEEQAGTLGCPTSAPPPAYDVDMDRA